MSDRDALLTAILANPDEDTPRLVFADWLDEHGDASPHAAGTSEGGSGEAWGANSWRAKFIRAGCAAARAAPYSQAKYDLTAQADGLQGLHGAEWAAGLDGLTVAARFARGFVEEVTMYSKRFVAAAAKVFAAQPVRVVKFADMTYSRGTAAPRDLFACPHLARLHTVEFPGLTVNDDFAAHLARSPHLAGLRCLRLRGCTVSPTALRAVLESDRLPSLVELELLDSTSIESDHLTAVAASPALSKLKVLSFRGCPVGPSGAVALAGSKHAAGLEVLRLKYERRPGHPPIRGPGAVALAESPHLGGLKELSLGRQELRRRGGELFAKAFAWSGMKRLALRGCDLGPQELLAIAANPAFRVLDELDLTGNPIALPDLTPLRAALRHTAVYLDAHNRLAPHEARP